MGLPSRVSRAFTLLELLVATACLAVTAIGILAAIGFSDTQNVLSRQRLIALSIASSEIEVQRSNAYGDALVAGVYNTNLSGSGLPSPATKTTTITATSDPTVFNITVQVSWTVTTAGGPTTRVIHLDTALQNNDVP
ncbi:MAG TPA: prepilin-type N-terminal cleavage/methylation domain-containing protein [Fimbriimonadaceae bacterium]|nr:prepilin-type N-terminal cleavage/methylation domain-containing protein [Fimbriimonadaceae bacterium]